MAKRETIAEWKQCAQTYKNAYRKEQRKNTLLWRWCVGVAVTAVVFLTAFQIAVVGWCLSSPTVQVQYPATTEEPKLVQKSGYTPNHLAACVRMQNGSNSCSGIVISKGTEYGYILSCGHCVAGHIGRGCYWYWADGVKFYATLIAYDHGKDLSLFKTESKNIRAYTYLHCNTPKGGKWEAAGYTDGGGLKYKTINPCPKGSNHYHITSGPFGGGDSGGPVYCNGGVASIIKACEKSNRRQDNKIIYPSTDHETLVKWVAKKTKGLDAKKNGRY